eukprot:m.220383 g.220383  ORF g.220383 m.220383 type:complete len:350 (-) comp19160_c0_seq2:450-1499(-)
MSAKTVKPFGLLVLLSSYQLCLTQPPPQLASNANGDLIVSVIEQGNFLVQTMGLDGAVVGATQSIATVDAVNVSVQRLSTQIDALHTQMLANVSTMIESSVVMFSTQVSHNLSSMINSTRIQAEYVNGTLSSHDSQLNVLNTNMTTMAAVSQALASLTTTQTENSTTLQAALDSLNASITTMNSSITSALQNIRMKMPPPVPLSWSGTSAAGEWHTIVYGSCQGISSCFNASYPTVLHEGAYILVINETNTFRASPTYRGMYQERVVSAPFAWENGITNSQNTNAFSSHQTGHANAAFSGAEIISFRTKRNLGGGTPNTAELQFSTNVAWTAEITLHMMAVPVYIDPLF